MSKPKNIIARDKTHLLIILDKTLKEYGLNCDLNHIDVSNITDMTNIFSAPLFYHDDDFNFHEFNGDISKWDVSNVKTMEYMFQGSKFKGDISKWDVSNVTSMHGMFAYSKFSGDISNWNTSNVKDMNMMFKKSEFNGNISQWDTSNVIDMQYLFYDSQFQGDISNWNFSSVKKILHIIDSNYNVKLPEHVLNKIVRFLPLKQVDNILNSYNYSLSTTHIQRCLAVKNKPKYINKDDFLEIKKLQTTCIGLGLNKVDTITYIFNIMKQQKTLVVDNMDFVL